MRPKLSKIFVVFLSLAFMVLGAQAYPNLVVNAPENNSVFAYNEPIVINVTTGNLSNCTYTYNNQVVNLVTTDYYHFSGEIPTSEVLYNYGNRQEILFTCVDNFSQVQSEPVYFKVDAGSTGALLSSAGLGFAGFLNNIVGGLVELLIALSIPVAIIGVIFGIRSLISKYTK